MSCCQWTKNSNYQHTFLQSHAQLFLSPIYCERLNSSSDLLQYSIQRSALSVLKHLEKYAFFPSPTHSNIVTYDNGTKEIYTSSSWFIHLCYFSNISFNFLVISSLTKFFTNKSFNFHKFNFHKPCWFVPKRRATPSVRTFTYAFLWQPELF